jgi:hypothetical protein
MFFLQQPPDTSAYMIAGYVVIFGTMLAYVFSLIIRRRNLEQDMQVLHGLQNSEQKISGKPIKTSDEADPSVSHSNG